MTAPSARDRLGELLGVVEALSDKVLALEAVAASPGAGKAGETGPRPFRWEDLGPDELRETWQALGAWVAWLCRRFAGEVVPPCWYEHGELVEEMTALWLAWQGAYRGDARPDEPVRWLDWLARSRARAARLPKCQVGAHKAPVAPPTHSGAAFAAFVDRQVVDAANAAAAAP